MGTVTATPWVFLENEVWPTQHGNPTISLMPPDGDHEGVV